MIINKQYLIIKNDTILCTKKRGTEEYNAIKFTLTARFTNSCTEPWASVCPIFFTPVTKAPYCNPATLLGHVSNPVKCSAWFLLCNNHLTMKCFFAFHSYRPIKFFQLNWCFGSPDNIVLLTTIRAINSVYLFLWTSHDLGYEDWWLRLTDVHWSYTEGNLRISFGRASARVRPSQVRHQHLVCGNVYFQRRWLKKIATI